LVSTKMAMNYAKKLNDNERIFLICDQCLWNVTCLNILHLHEILATNDLCPVCNQAQLSSFPVKPDDSFKYAYSKKGGFQLTLGKKNIT
jgi:rubrerythrin